ncbi:MAG: sulfurtransferase [Cyanobacteria bacterium P01_F01_bin.86]
MTQLDLTLPTPLVDIDWVQAHLHHPEMVLVDCRFALNDPQQGRRAYEQGHLPGAYYLDLNEDLSSPVQTHGGRHPLPDPNQLVAKLESLGIASTPATAVVAYDATKGAFASRLWWLLRYLGHDNVAVLNGGLPAWQAADYPLEQSLPQSSKSGEFIPSIQANWVVDRDYVIHHKDDPGTTLIDSRSPERFRGEQEPIDPIAGSIPGALNCFWQSNMDEQGRFKSMPDLQQNWAPIPPSETLIIHCGSGVTACVNALAQTVLGNPMPKLYIGGWSDWCSYQK